MIEKMFNKEISKIEQNLSDISKLKLAGISRSIDEGFCEMYAKAIVRMLEELGVKNSNEQQDNDVYYFDFKHRNRFHRMKEQKILGISYRRYKSIQNLYEFEYVEYNGAYYEFWEFFEDDYATAAGYVDAVNCSQLQLIGAERWEEIYNCLRLERGRRKKYNLR